MNLYILTPPLKFSIMVTRRCKVTIFINVPSPRPDIVFKPGNREYPTTPLLSPLSKVAYPVLLKDGLASIKDGRLRPTPPF